MQVEQPHHPPSGLGDFLRQYAMIVLSILTALALERGAVAIHDASAARDSRVRIEAELAHNLADLRSSQSRTAENIKAVQATMKSLIAMLKAGKPDDATLLALVAPVYDHFAISLPSWQRDAWDEAIADQSASHLAAADLQHYAEIYASARDSADLVRLLLSGEWLSRAAELRVDVALGHLEGRTLANALVRYLHAAQQIEANMESLEALIADDSARK